MLQTEDRALQERTSSTRCSLANCRAWRPQVAHRPKGRHLPEQVQSVKSQGVRGTESSDSSHDTVKDNRELRVRFFGELQIPKAQQLAEMVPELERLRAQNLLLSEQV